MKTIWLKAKARVAHELSHTSHSRVDPAESQVHLFKKLSQSIDKPWEVQGIHDFSTGFSGNLSSKPPNYVIIVHNKLFKMLALMIGLGFMLRQC
jgi:hypothetical protein